MYMIMCENYMLCQTHLLRLNSSGCLKYVIAPTDTEINWVEVANTVTCRPGGVTMQPDINNINFKKWYNRL